MFDFSEDDLAVVTCGEVNPNRALVVRIEFVLEEVRQFFGDFLASRIF